MNARLSLPLAAAVSLFGVAAHAADPVEAPTPAPIAAGDEWALGGLQRLDLATGLGVAHRLDEPAWFRSVEADALSGSVEVRAFFARRFAATLGWERFGLGVERSGVTELGSIAVSRRVDGAWLGLRLEPWRTDWMSAFVGFGAGLAWQHASASGLLWPTSQPDRAAAVSCDASDSPSPALRVDLGLEAPVAPGFTMFAAGGLGVLALSDGPLGSCVVGAGSAQVLGGRAGLAYAFDLGGGGG